MLNKMLILSKKSNPIWNKAFTLLKMHSKYLANVLFLPRVQACGFNFFIENKHFLHIKIWLKKEKKLFFVYFFRYLAY